MPMMAINATRPRSEGFSHEALMYADMEGFLDGTLPFLREGIGGGEAIFVVVSAEKIAILQGELGDDAGSVRFRDMGEIGLNPARIIPAWRDFADASAAGGRPFRGIGEPIWATRTAAALAECQRHESLLNLAFADSGPFRLLCPYDTTALSPDVIAEAHHSHPVIVEGTDQRESSSCRTLDAVAAPFDWPLPDPPENVQVLDFGIESLRQVRDFVGRFARIAGLMPSRVDDLVLAANEVATNSVRHGGGHGLLSVWCDNDSITCEVRDAGRIVDPMAGRQRGKGDAEGGLGLWIANQLCDLVQVRCFPTAGVVRLHMVLTTVDI